MSQIFEDAAQLGWLTKSGYGDALKREEEQRKLVEQFRAPQYRDIISRWQEYLEGETGAEPTAGSERPVVELAREIIYRKFRKVMKDGNAILPTSPDEDLHRLRIQCKKLRYILEFFSSLFPKKNMRLVISHLKRLQNNLGDFNDLSVQRAELKSYLQSGRGAVPVETAAAVGALVARLEDRQVQVRTHFAESFAAFAGGENRRRFDELFGTLRGL